MKGVENSQDWKKRQKARKHQNIQPIIPSKFRCPTCGSEYEASKDLAKHYGATGH